MAKHWYDRSGNYKGTLLSDEEHGRRQRRPDGTELPDGCFHLFEFFLFWAWVGFGLGFECNPFDEAATFHDYLGVAAAVALSFVLRGAFFVVFVSWIVLWVGDAPFLSPHDYGATAWAFSLLIFGLGLGFKRLLR